MTPKTCLSLGLAFALAAFSGCSKGSGSAPSGAASGAAASGSTGLDAPGNNPAIVAAVKKTLAECATKWTDKAGFSDCKAYGEYLDLKLDQGKNDATFVNLLEDKDPKVRKHALDGLNRSGDLYKTDKALAERVVGALEAEKTPALDGELAFMVTRIQVPTVPLGDRIKAVALKPDATDDVKQFLGAYWGYNSTKENALAYDTSKTLAASTNERVKRGGLQGLQYAFDAHTDEACKLWFGSVNDADPKTASTAMALITGGGGWSASDEDSGWGASTGGSRDKACPQASEVVDLITKRGKDGTVKESDFVYALGALLGPKTDAPLRAKAEEGLKAIVQNKANGWTRSTALGLLVDKDPKQKTFAAKFTADPDLKDTVKGIMARKK